MPVGGLTKPLQSQTLKVYVGTFTGPASYTAGGFTVTIDELGTVQYAIVQASDGYIAEVARVSGNTITIRVYHFDYAATAAGPAVEVPAGTDLSYVTFTVIAVGTSTTPPPSPRVMMT